MNNKKPWKLVALNEHRVAILARELRVPETVARVYIARGLDTQASLEVFCNLSLSKMHDPFLLPDMENAVSRICHAVNTGEQIFVHGDGDADGITSAALLVIFLESLGAKVRWYIPNRLNDGFGLSTHAVKFAHEFQSKLIITTDCGTEAFVAAELATELGIDLIITDHHMPSADGGLPDCIAVVNPQRKDSIYPFAGLAGVGVAFKLVLALCQRLGDLQNVEQLIELVAIGTVADIAPMIDENRVLVAAGCEALALSNRPGLKQLIDIAGVRKIDTTAIGFYLAPRLNAAWRLYDPSLAMQLLLETNEILAGVYAYQLNDINRERKELQQNIVERIFEDIPEGFDDRHAIVLANESISAGLNGLVASSLVNVFNKPAFMASLSPSGSVVGSCRSVDGFDVLAALDACRDLLHKYGGHKKAAGFELPVENFDEFSARLNAYAKHSLAKMEAPSLLIDAYLLYRDINIRTYEQVTKLAPFGVGNPEPIFATNNLTVEHCCSFGKNGKHLKLKLSNNGSRNSFLTAIAWRQGEEVKSYPVGSMVDVAYKLGIDDFRKNASLILTIEDIKAKMM